jgi:hypothetical protein
LLAGDCLKKFWECAHGEVGDGDLPQLYDMAGSSDANQMYKYYKYLDMYKAEVQGFGVWLR